MNATFAIIGSVFVFLAAVVHLGIFALESVLWSRPSTWKAFGVADQRDAEVLRPMAYNQGFYNLFLAIGAGVGLVLLGTGASREGGIAIAMFSLGSMLLAAIVLIASNPRLARAALVQGAPPLLGLIFLALALLGQ
jgi:putative membrane protein